MASELNGWALDYFMGILDGSPLEKLNLSMAVHYQSLGHYFCTKPIYQPSLYTYPIVHTSPQLLFEVNG